MPDTTKLNLGNNIGIILEAGSGQNEGGSGIVVTSAFLSPDNRALPTGNTIQGNYIGTDVTGIVALPNERAGILLLFRATENQIGAVHFNATNFASGVYFVKMLAGLFTNIQKLTLIK